MAGALAQHAEATLERIGTEREPIVREIFRNLVTAQGTRAVLDVEELLSVFAGPSGEREQSSGNSSTPGCSRRSRRKRPRASRPTTASRSSTSRCCRRWPRLVRWQTQDADGAQLRDQLRQAAHLWEERGKADDLLWTGTSYREYRVWRERYPGGLSSLEESFAARWRRARSGRGAGACRLRRRARGGRAGRRGLGMMWRKSVRETRRAEAEAARAEAGKLLALGRLKLADSPNAALAYAIASLERSDNDPARRFAVEALWQGPPALFIRPDPLRVRPRVEPRRALGCARDSHGLSLVATDTNERRQLASA